MIAARYVVTDGPRHFAAEPITDDTLDAMRRGTRGPTPGEGPRAPHASRDESRQWRVEAEQAMREGDARLALRCWRVVRQFEPTAPDVLFRLGCCHALVGEAAQAAQAFESLTRMHGAPGTLRKRATRLMRLVDPTRN